MTQSKPAFSVMLPATLRSSIRSKSLARRLCTLSAHTTAAKSVQETLKRDPDLPTCRVLDFRDCPIPYHHGWDVQHAVADELRRNSHAPDTLILLEHYPVYTLGTASKLENVLFPADAIHRRGDRTSATTSETSIAEAPIVRTERGGEVTYHGPGQLVVYPILNLRRHKQDLHWYLRSLEDMVIHMLRNEYGLEGDRKEGLTGVWVGDNKVCAMGLKVSKWVTMHGIALNVQMDLSPFRRIIPCGISTHGVSSVQKLVGKDMCLLRARQGLLASFDATFGPYNFTSAEQEDLVKQCGDSGG